MKRFTDEKIKSKSVCIVGAGPSGLSLLHAFNEAKKKGKAVPEKVVCYEKQGQVGGLWNFSPRVGIDANGEPQHCSMYRHLWSNAPKECLEFTDYSYDEHFKKRISSYPPREALHDYMMGRLVSKGVELENHCMLNHVVRRVTWNGERKKFLVVTRNLTKAKRVLDLDDNSSERDESQKDDALSFQTTKMVDSDFEFEFAEEYDYVVVASGHYSTPYIPNFHGMETFIGRVLHAHDFNDAVEFKNRTILIIGTSYSAEDIGSQCFKFGCKHVYFSWRTSPMGYDWPGGKFTTVGLLEKIETVEGKSACYFKGVKDPIFDIDAIILCTGYRHNFPFMSRSLRLKTTNRLWIESLCKGIFWYQNPNLMYMGMHNQVYTWPMFDAQAWLIRDFILGKYRQPVACTKNMLDIISKKNDDEKTAGEKKAEANYMDTLMWMEREAWVIKNLSVKAMVEFQGDYVKTLCELSDYPSVDVDSRNGLFLDWAQNKQNNIMTFRDIGHKSSLTGTVGLVPHKPWLQSYDDSLEAFTADVEDQKAAENQEAAEKDERLVLTIRLSNVL